jgi:hypothetical protein
MTTSFFIPDLPSTEELRASDQARQSAAAQYLHERPGAFVGVSLGAWLQHAQHAGVPHVPANEVARVSRWQFLNFQESNEADRQMWKSVRDLRHSVPADHMVRWDPCAELGLKQAMAKSKLDMAIEASHPVHPEADPRTYDILYDYPLEKVSLWSRPWVKAQMHESHPVEFRVFVRDSRVLGVANYYVQRALPESPEILRAVNTCIALSAQLVGSMQEHGAFPWMPHYEKMGFDMSAGAIHATLDFLVSEGGQVLLLEAGPPFGAGAHPCAFQGKEHITGLALGLGSW